MGIPMHKKKLLNNKYETNLLTYATIIITLIDL